MAQIGYIVDLSAYDHAVAARLRRWSYVFQTVVLDEALESPAHWTLLRPHCTMVRS
jgi:hypothetical protein